MKNERINIEEEIIIRYLEDELKNGEKHDLEKWIKESDENRLYFEQVKKIYLFSENLNDFEKIDQKKDFETIAMKLKKTEHTNRNLFLRIAASIAIILSLAISGLFYYSNNKVYEIANTEDQAIEKVLPDGSQVWLNKNSRIIYRGSFNKKTRKINFEGEAFFEIAKNPDKPFKIKTQNTMTTVLGTSFNLKTLKNETEIIVVTGKVSFEANYNEIILDQGYKGLYNSQNNILESNTNENRNFLSWKNKTLIFKNDPLSKIISDLEDYYKMKIIIEKENIEDIRFTSTFINQPLEEILEELSFVLNLNYRYEPDKIIIY